MRTTVSESAFNEDYSLFSGKIWRWERISFKSRFSFLAKISHSVGYLTKSNVRIKTRLKTILNFAKRRILSLFVIFKLIPKNSKFITLLFGKMLC